jgi:hypothetical protein
MTRTCSFPADQAQSCLTPEGERSGYEQFQQFDSFPQPASRGYLCINIPPGGTFVIDHLFAEADYEADLPAGAEWYLDKWTGGYEAMSGFAAVRTGSATHDPHYVLSVPVHLAVGRPRRASSNKRQKFAIGFRAQLVYDSDYRCTMCGYPSLQLLAVR